jgi:hypothetical protein
MTDPSVVQKRLICIAHKSSKIGEQCSLYQQNSPAMPENPAAFWREELQTGYFNLIILNHTAFSKNEENARNAEENLDFRRIIE